MKAGEQLAVSTMSRGSPGAWGMGRHGDGGTGPTMQVHKGEKRGHPEQADLRGAFWTQGGNEPVGKGK